VSDPPAITRLTGQAQPLDDDALTALYLTGHPATEHLRANFVASLDGAVEVGGVTAGLSSRQDQRLMGLLRMQCDALLLGAGTLRVEGYAPVLLNERLRGWRTDRGLPAHPTLAVVSGSLRLDPAQPVFADAPTRPIVFTHANAPASARAALAAIAEVVTAGEDAVDLTAAVAWLHRRGFGQILCEGGPHLLGGLIAADLVDELCLTVSPLLAGAGAGRIAAGPTSPVRRMSLRHVLAAGDHLLLRYHRPREDS
jgi:riboflavin biosynthesis pyrimidine reductase